MPEARASVISPSASRIQKFPFRERDDGRQREDSSELSSGSVNLRLVQAFEVGDYRSGCRMRWTAFTVGSRCLSKRDVHKLVGASVDVLVPAASSAGAPCFSIALHSHWTTPIPALPAPHTTNLRMRERGRGNMRHREYWATNLCNKERGRERSAGDIGIKRKKRTNGAHQWRHPNGDPN